MFANGQRVLLVKLSSSETVSDADKQHSGRVSQVRRLDLEHTSGCGVNRKNVQASRKRLCKGLEFLGFG